MLTWLVLSYGWEAPFACWVVDGFVICRVLRYLVVLFKGWPPPEPG